MFPPTTPAGHGTVHLTANPPQFRTLTYAYPLKLISPAPLHRPHRVIQTLYLLTYGGGLVAGDAISLAITLDPATALILLTQGSTKLFKTPDPAALVSRQKMEVRVGKGARLFYVPDPVQPYADSAFEQSQVYSLDAAGDASLCVCDWVCCGRAARGERWGFWRYASRNEVWDVGDQVSTSERRLLLRDNLVLDRRDGSGGDSIAARVDGVGVFGTLILRGPAFDSVGTFFVDEFEKLPRIGAKRWDGEIEDIHESDSPEGRRLARQRQETEDGLIWTAASIRGFVMIKFGAREVEGAKRWLRTMFREDGSVEQQFGERALLCLK
jgi:urease accessory protein